jgi:hypothetical protein
MTFITGDDYRLVNVTDPEKVNFTRLQNSQSWKGQLSSENYIEREYVLGKSKITLSTRNRLLVFMLQDIKNPEDKLCSVELLIRQSWKFTWDKETEKVVKKDILSGCIGGVFTYADHRGKGLAKIMIDKIVELSKSQYVGPDGFTFLYSEVGEYYTRNGFRSFAVPLLNFPLSQTGDDYDAIVQQDEDVVELIKYHDFEKVMEDYNKEFETEMISKTKMDRKTRVSINPSLDFIDWFHMRAKFISHKLFNRQMDIDSSLPYEELIKKFQAIDPTNFGIKIKNKLGQLIGFISWTYDWNLNTATNKYENQITILKIAVMSQFDNLKYSIKLIKLMKLYLEHMNATNDKILGNFVKTTVWESEVSNDVKQFLITEYKGTDGIENGSRSAILINNDKEDKLLATGDLVWEDNTKLPWF